MILLDQDLDPYPARARSAQGHPSAPTSPARSARVPSVRVLSAFLRSAQAAVKLRGRVAVLLTTDREIRRLNRSFRGKNEATDVLSFPAAHPAPVSKSRPGAPARERASGDVAISAETAARQAAEQGHALVVEIKVLLLHGLLHLAGYDHENDEGRMERRERKLRSRLGLPLGLIERTTSGAKAPGKVGSNMYGLKPVPSRAKPAPAAGTNAPRSSTSQMSGLKPGPTEKAPTLATTSKRATTAKRRSARRRKP